MTRLINDEYMGVLISEWHQIYSPLAVTAYVPHSSPCLWWYPSLTDKWN